ncbi:phosphoenolpyruvate--protein phosphotransferase [Sporomusa malonica]|uniref:Phosphoenolpyruvate-protein phosphotransferase n=1 Tax=Sporomusa malonica TaxID=112901 RepID=A0A1W2D4W5_9FIRM|nr:phosphoenolpyruvate--protein phosphotransferase [Sporomusa malonica]SMC92226.1 phosphotransferase system, enzyme I, PtsI [Sporomusa malonica]
MGDVLRGTGVVAGIAIANAKVLSGDLTGYLNKYNAGTPDVESGKMTEAIKAASAELAQLIATAKANSQDSQADIMDAHYTMVNDPGLAANMYGKIEQGTAAPQAALTAAEEFATLFDSMPDPYLRERAADVRDVGRRLARLLLGVGHIQYEAEAIVLCAEEIEPSVAASMPEGPVCGIVLGKASTTSHTVIIAKARGIPTVAGLGSSLTRIADGTAIIVDGNTGQVLLEPTPEQLAEYQHKAEAEAARRQQDAQLAALEAVTLDGKRIQLAANVGSPSDMTAARKQGAEGVGLFRSEYLFMGRAVPPSEEEQFAAYKEVAEQCGSQLCVIRTMDIGGDKPLHYLNIAKEENPFLGWRAIRISLERTDLFITQLKAILRAGAFGKVAIMLPMIISTAEITAARECVKQAVAELRMEGKAFAPDVPLGIMIETPAAAVMAQQLAGECDFFSIGTNDLVQYTLAVDRGNPAVSSLYSHFHPAVLALIDNVVKAGHNHNIWVGMCGEMAGDPLAAPLLTAMGIDELSMSAPSIPRVKAVIRKLEEKPIRELLEQALALNEARAIRRLMEDYISGQ